MRLVAFWAALRGSLTRHRHAYVVHDSPGVGVLGAAVLVIHIPSYRKPAGRKGGPRPPRIRI